MTTLESGMATTLDIVRICEALDGIAVRTYRKLAASAEDPEVRALWASMAAAEAQHVAFWRKIVAVGQREQLPEVFENPEEVLQELQALVPEAQALLEHTDTTGAPLPAPLVALRLEFSMINPSFEILFHLLKPLGGDLAPDEDYQDHILQLGQLVALQSGVNPQLRLMAEMLQQLWRKNRHLALYAAVDPLTEAFNRRSFQALSSQLFQLAAPRGESVGVLMVDVDDFKPLNDRRGHAFGDKVLRGVAQAIRSSLRSSDLLGRYGGDEFVVCLAPVKEGSIRDVAEKARAAVEAFRPGGETVTLSLGGCTAPAASAEPAALLQAMIQEADRRLYVAKGRGKNRTCVDGPPAEPSSLPPAP